MAEFRVYVLRSGDARRTYVGITTDVERRLAQHNGEQPGGAKSTRSGRPWTLARLSEPFTSRGAALRAERAAKSLRGPARLNSSLADPQASLIAAGDPLSGVEVIGAAPAPPPGLAPRQRVRDCAR